MKNIFAKKKWHIFFLSFLLFSLIVAPPHQGSLADTTVQEGQHVNLDYRDAELSTVVRSLSHSYNLNLVAPQDLKGKVTISLRDVTIDEALVAILGVNGYAFTRKGNIIYIARSPGINGVDVQTITIPLKYLPAAEASALLEKVISSDGDIRVNDTTNSLVVTDFPSYIEKLRSVLTEIDVPPVQVLIEAKLVDITEKDYQNYGLTVTDVTYAPGEGLFGGDTMFPESLELDQSMAGPSSNVSGGQMGLSFTLKSVSGSVTLDALIQDQKAHLLASPSILTLNGKEARIIIGERYPYKEKTQTTTGTTETTKFVDIGTTLRVTPWVSPDGWITMYVHPEVSSFTAALDAGPRISTREADATIRVRDGETIVIGGLIKRQDDHTKGKIPLLGYIPIVGWLFSNTSTDKTSTELVVFITPRVVKTKQAGDIVQPSRREEVHVSIDGVAEQSAVDQLWQEARDLERGRGIISRRKSKHTRMEEAMNRYKIISSQFEGSEWADDALLRGGLLAYKYFDDLALSKKFFLTIAVRYPDSPYVNKSRKMIDLIEMRTGAEE